MSLHFHHLFDDFRSSAKERGNSNKHKIKPQFSTNNDDLLNVGALLGIVETSDDESISAAADTPEDVVHHPAHHHVASRKHWPFGTYKFYEVPPNFKENSIYSGYRSPTSTVKECIKYCFTTNNEIMNVWTHFLAFLGFVVYVVHLGWTRKIDFQDSYTWPYMTYVVSCCTYSLVSSFAHCFSCLSSRSRHVLFFMDYSAISLYGLATSIAHYSYSFPHDFNGTSLKYLYLPVAFYNACLMTVLACESRFIEFSPSCKKFRLLAFAIPGVWSFSPLLYRLTLGSQTLNNVTPKCIFHHKMQFTSALVSSVLYGIKVPESVFPGKFDNFFHSHQIFHVTCTISTLFQMWGIEDDMEFFRDKRRHDPTCFIFLWSVGIWLLLLLWCALIVFCCAQRVFTFRNEQLHNMLMHVPKITCRKDTQKHTKQTWSQLLKPLTDDSTSSEDDSPSNEDDSTSNKEGGRRNAESERGSPKIEVHEEEHETDDETDDDEDQKSRSSGRESDKESSGSQRGEEPGGSGSRRGEEPGGSGSQRGVTFSEQKKED